MRVFISTIQGEEASIAQVLKRWVESSFGSGCDVFLATDPDDMPAGGRWLDQLHTALWQASVLLVLCDKRVHARPWLNFEVACGWLQRIPVIPICHSGQSAQHLPTTMNMYEALSLDDSDFVRALMSSLSQALHMSEVPLIDEPRMRHELAEVYREYREKKRRIDVTVARGSSSWPRDLALSFQSGSQRDLIEDVARILNLNRNRYGIDWHLRDGRRVLDPHEGRVRAYRALTGLKQSVVLTIESEENAFGSARPNKALQPASRPKGRVRARKST